MQGEPSWWNYFLSFKWQLGMGNEFALFGAGESFTVPANSVQWPSGWGIDGAWKGPYGQRVYVP